MSNNLKQRDTDDKLDRDLDVCSICKDSESRCRFLFENPVCIVCEDKYGDVNKIKNKLIVLGLYKELEENLLDEPQNPEPTVVTLDGEINSKDRAMFFIHMLMEEFDIDLDELDNY